MNWDPQRWLGVAAALALWLTADWAFGSQATEVDLTAPAPRAPRLSPDYNGTVLPPNIAPLNFLVEEPGDRFHVQIHSILGRPIEISSRTPAVIIPLKQWREMLRANLGQPLYFEVAVRDHGNSWIHFATVTNTIAREDIDGYLVYRLLKPLYNFYTDIGIYQRNLQNYEQREVLHNRSFDQGCLNCHTFLNQNPDHMALHIRSKPYGNAMLLVSTNEVVKVAKTAGYLSWHPSGRLIVFSANKLSLFFHTKGETRDVFDAESNLSVYRLDSNTIVTPAAITRTNHLETWPTWSPDGRFLYFCSAPKLGKDRFREVRYDLMRISYDLERDTWGELETVVAAHDTGLSAAEPRVSPDGRFLLFCLSQYGNFPVYQPSSDLYLMDLATRQSRRLDINSDKADSWHSWSSNSRWVVFSSKRRDGLFARPYISYVDELGTFHKPVLLPQQDPAFYDSFIKTFNVPELIRKPIRVTSRDLARAVVSPRTVLTPKTETAPEQQVQQTPETEGDDQGLEHRR